MFHESKLLDPSLFSFVTMGCFLFYAGPVFSQDLPSATEIVRCFAETYADDGRQTSGCGSLSTGVTGVLTSPDRFPAALFDGVMDGLVELATSHPDDRVRRSAAVWIAIPGTATELRSGVVQRMRMVYDQSDDPDVRAVLVGYSPRQQEIDEATRFLVDVATGDRGRDVAPFPDEVLALDALSKIGPAGKAALEQIHASQSVKTEAAKKQLNQLARGGFQPIDYRREGQNR